MGLQQSKSQSNQPKSQASSTNYYGGTLMHNPQTNTTYQQFIIDQKYYDKFLILIRTRQKLQHQNFITVKNHWKKNINNNKFTCANDKKVQVFVQYQSLSENLSKKLDKLSQKSISIPQNQLIKIFLSILSCLKYLKLKGTCHGDIKPQSIFFDNLGKIKLSDSFFINGGRTSYEIVMQNPSSMSLLSPQQLAKLRDKQFDDISLIYQNEVFSLGLTMYQCMTFEPAMQCYDLEKLKIKKDYFKDKEQIMYNNGYSPHLVKIVYDLIKKPAQSRPNFNQLYEALTQLIH